MTFWLTSCSIEFISHARIIELFVCHDSYFGSPTAGALFEPSSQPIFLRPDEKLHGLSPAKEIVVIKFLSSDVNRRAFAQTVLETELDVPTNSEGLLYAGNDTLFESTGLYTHSSVRKVALQTGQVEALHKMDSSYFGEGLTLFGERLFQVTWLTNTGLIYDRNNLSKSKKFTHQMQDGWGLATDEKVLFGSDGTSTLYKLDPQTLKVMGKQTIKYKGHEVHNLNELEYVNDEVWANIFQSDCIARISYKDGTVVGWILLHNLREGLISSGSTNIDVLNGIAWDREKNRLFVTGKLWPKLFEIKLHPLTKPFNGDIKEICMQNPVHFAKP